MTEETCQTCNGSQTIRTWDGYWEDCPDCSGFGYVIPTKPKPVSKPFGHYPEDNQNPFPDYPENYDPGF